MALMSRKAELRTVMSSAQLLGRILSNIFPRQFRKSNDCINHVTPEILNRIAVSSSIITQKSTLGKEAFICINRNKIKAHHLFDRSVYPLPTFRVVVLIIGAIKEILLLQVNMRRTLMGSAFLSEQSWLGANGDPLQGFWQQIYR
ncbi:hypothetical protein CEXT_531241 [Caerostris extrusa]|uniref:Uncharacterized protein n=1 Tax=Caerostris extrusa TaxID=172846 RepID=A0AAV4NCM2_CAEEX|nr:hypothetical protein CEXT_531241 [Caerostris extrusa]